jgi:hypothetical protein
MTLVVVSLAAATVSVQATPIRPDLNRLLADPPAPAQFVPARAGWHGPETPAPARASAAAMHGVASAKAVRASLVAAAIPDPWAVLAIAMAILFLRWARLKGSRQQLRPESPEEELPEIRRAA